MAKPRAGSPIAAFIPAGCALALLLSACASPPAVPVGGQTDALAQVGRWTLQGATAPDGRPLAALSPHGAPVHAIEFADARLTVHGGCNHIGGAYRYSADGALVVQPLESTLMACADTALMDADRALATMLDGSATFRIAEIWPEQLTLDHDDGSRSQWVADRQAP